MKPQHKGFWDLEREAGRKGAISGTWLVFFSKEGLGFGEKWSEVAKTWGVCSCIWVLV